MSHCHPVDLATPDHAGDGGQPPLPLQPVMAAYRELRGIAEAATSIAAAPSREQEFHRQMWTQATAALGQQADAGAVDYRTLPDLDLYAVRDRWTREQGWAPEYVAQEMRTAYQLGREYTEDAALGGARLGQPAPDGGVPGTLGLLGADPEVQVCPLRERGSR